MYSSLGDFELGYARAAHNQLFGKELKYISDFLKVLKYISDMALIFPQADPKKWSELYGIIVDEEPCPKCQVPVKFDVPAALKGYRGLMAEKCVACGFESRMLSVVPVGQLEVQEWESLRPAIGPQAF